MAAEPQVEPTRPAAPLPAAVRQRVVGWAAQALPGIDGDHLPPALRKVAKFTPARRAKLAGASLAATIESDDGFRERVGVHVAAAKPELVRSVSAGTTGALDPADVAAIAYLVRDEGWQSLLDASVAALEADQERADAEEGETEQTLERLRTQLSGLRSEVKELKAAHRDALDRIKQENIELRRKLGDARVTARQATEESEALRTSTEQDRARDRARVVELESEVRRVRQQLDESRAETGDQRRQARDDRTQSTVRARLLLETLIESAQGLRRELALPPVDGLPGDQVAVETPSSEAGRHPVISDAARLQVSLELPRTHLIVDGYNVSKGAWPEVPLDRQRMRLQTALAALAARTRAEVTLVFDGANATPAAVVSPRGVRVRFSPPGVIADEVIADFVNAEPAGRPVLVVSSDAEVAAHARRSGARAVTSDALIDLLTRS